MNTLFIGKVWQHFDSLPSTNDYAAELLAAASPQSRGLRGDGAVFTTFNQTFGRGQMGNRWLSEPDKNLAFTVILQPNFLLAREQFHLNKAVALAVHDVVSAVVGGGKSSVKWANDIFVLNQKVAGILIQNTLTGDRLQNAIVGIGLNINQLDFSKDLNATSLALETDHELVLFDMVEKLAQALERRYLSLKNATNFPKIHDEYLSKMYRFGVESLFQRTADGHVFYGKITGVSPIGKLEIATADGLQSFDIKAVKFLQT